MGKNLLFLGVSANQAVLIVLIAFLVVMAIYVFSRVCSGQWKAFWGVVGHGLAVFFWAFRYAFNLVVDSINPFSERKFTNNLRRYREKLAKAAPGSAEEQKYSRLVAVNEAGLADFRRVRSLPVTDVDSAKAAKLARKSAAKVAGLRRRLNSLGRWDSVRGGRLADRVASAQRRLSSLTDDNDARRVALARLEYCRGMLAHHQFLVAGRREAIEAKIAFHSSIGSSNAKERKSFRVDRAVKKQQLRRDAWGMRRKTVRAYRRAKHPKIVRFIEGRQKWNERFSENIRNRYAAFVHGVDQSIREWRHDNMALHLLIRVGAVLLLFLLVFAKLVAAFGRDLMLWLVAVFSVRVPIFFVRLPFGVARFFIDFWPVLRYEVIVFFRDNWRVNLRGYVYLAPMLVLLVVFTFYPIINTIILSFKVGYRFSDGAYTNFGFDGYLKVLNHGDFRTALKNTFFLVFVSVPISVALALIISVALNSIKKFQGVLQTLFFLPYLTNTVAISMVFMVLFADGQSGFVNQVLGWFGMNPVTFRGGGADGATATWLTCMIVIISYSIWNSLAFKIMVFLSGMQNINKQYYQASRIDGTSKLRTFFRITVPMISPMIAYVTITSFIGTFKAYTSVVTLYGDGYAPAGQKSDRILITIVGFIMDQLSIYNNPGALTTASAGAVILLLMIMAFTAVQMYISKKRVHY